jgi:hypothetical protein
MMLFPLPQMQEFQLKSVDQFLVFAMKNQNFRHLENMYLKPIIFTFS